MLDIKFKKRFNKLLDSEGKVIKTAKLLMVLSVAQDDLPRDFLMYESDGDLSLLGYSLYWALLILQKPDGNILTTIRHSYSRYGNTSDYYKEFIGQTFNIIIE